MEELLEVVEVDTDAHVSWCSIFNNFKYYQLHQTARSWYFALRDKSNQEVTGVCHFTETEPGIFVSPYRGTYAGVELQKNNLPALIFFMEKLEVLLKEKGARKIIVSTAPFDHNNTFSSHLFNSLLNLGYKIETQDLNYALRVDEKDLIEKMHYNNRKRLKKCIREGYIFERVQTREEYEEIYNIIAANRISKGYNISMTFAQIMQMHELFNDSVSFFKVSTGGICAAGSICIKISVDILYVFYWGDLPGYEQFSPISMIADGIYRFAQQNNFKLLDAGISTLRGIPNFGLAKFKENLGFDVSLKLRYEKTV